MSIIKILAPNWNAVRDLQCIDNSELREQARQRRQELARLQQPPEKQPTKNLFGPPIPVSRPNDPISERLSNFFGNPVGADISCFRSSSNSDHSPKDGGLSRSHGARHDDLRRSEHRQNGARHRDSRQTDTWHGYARHGDTRHGDARHGDERHQDSTPCDNRKVRADESVVKNSRPNHGVAVSSSELSAEPLRQGVFEQFVESSSKTSSTANLNKVPKTCGSRQSTNEGKVKHSTDSSKDSKLSESSAYKHSNGSTALKSERQSKQPTANQSKYSPGPAAEASQILSSSFSANRMTDVGNGMKNSPLNHRTNCGKDYKKLFSGRANGTHQGVDVNAKNAEVDKKLTLHIPKDYKKCDDFVTKVIQEVSIRSPLTGILTPTKTEVPFSFPEVNQQSIETIPEGLLSSDEDDGNGVDKVEREPVQRLEHVFDSTGKTIPNQNPSLFRDLEISESSSDSEAEQAESANVDQRTPHDADQSGAADRQSSGTVRSEEDARSRRLSESSESSSEESCTSESESDSSQSENEDEKETKKINAEKDESDEAQAKQSKRTSWELKSFIPKSNEHVPFILSSSPSPPFVNMIRQTSGDDFDIDINDPITEYMMSPSPQVLSPLPTATSDVEHVESNHSADVVRLSSPKILQSPGTVVGQHPVAPSVDMSCINFANSERGPKSCKHSPLHSSSSSRISGVDYCAGKPSVVVRIRRSYLLKKAKNAKCKDSVSNSAGRITGSASTVFSKSAIRTDCGSSVQTGCEPDLASYSPESVAKFDKSSANSDSSLPRNSSCRLPYSDSLAAQTLSATSAVPVPSFKSASANHKKPKSENSPAKIGQDETDDLLASKATKRKSNDADQFVKKKNCDRSSVTRKEDQKSQSQLQNGSLDGLRKPLVTHDIKTELKSPTMNGEDNSSRSSLPSSSQVQKGTEKVKAQNGHLQANEKMRKTSVSKVNGKITNSETLDPVSSRGTKISTPVVNGIEESPSHPNRNICNGGLSSDDLNDNGKQTSDHDDIDRLRFNQKNPLNGIKRFKYELEKLESSEVYYQKARKFKREGDSGPDKFSKVLNYTESVLAFVCHCSALEAEHVEVARIQKTYQDTLAFCQYIVRVLESVGTPEKYLLIVINLKVQAIISLRLYSIRKADVSKLKSVLDEHNKSHLSKPLQTPSPYQTNHHHSANNAAVSWNHANGTPSPRSPRPSPSPAGSIGSVGSVGSSNGDIGMAKPTSFVNGHSLASVGVPQRIHSVMMNFLNYMNCLHQCHDYWDQAEAILAAHPTVGDFFHSIDAEFGPMDLHSSTLAIVHYASEVVKHVRSKTKRLSEVARTD